MIEKLLEDLAHYEFWMNLKWGKSSGFMKECMLNCRRNLILDLQHNQLKGFNHG